MKALTILIFCSRLSLHNDNKKQNVFSCSIIPKCQYSFIDKQKFSNNTEISNSLDNVILSTL